MNKINKDINCKCFLFENNNSRIIFNDNIYKEKGFNSLIKIIEANTRKENSIDNKDNKFSIIKFIKKINKHKESAEIIIELSNGLFISSSIDHIIEIYDHSFKKIKQIELGIQESFTYSHSICEIYPNTNYTKLFIGSKIDYFLIDLNYFECKKYY